MNNYFDPEILNLPELPTTAPQVAAIARREHGIRLPMPTVPVLLAGSVALALSMPIADRPATATPNHGDSNGEPDDAVSASGVNYGPPKSPILGPRLSAAPSAAVPALAPVPDSYVVKKGDTVSAIAGRFGLSTAKVLAWNGLSWSSLIFPGQKLALSAPGSNAGTVPAAAPAPTATGSGSATHYIVRSGDTVSAIAARHGVSTASVLAANGLGWKSLIFPGQKLTIPVKATPAVDVTPAPAPAPEPVTPPTTPGQSVPASTPDDIVPVQPTAACASVTYTITTGDSVSRIAQKFGVSTNAVLAANNLSVTSIIYAGRTLTIPSPTTLVDNCIVHAELSPQMRANSEIIVRVGREAGVSDYGLIIALAAAAQESGLININYGDRDSVGLFQQRPSTGWGTAAEIMDPVHAAKSFFGGAGNPNPGQTRGLLDIPGWQQLTVTQAAQAVQLSGHPNAYAKWESSARYWLTQLG